MQVSQELPKTESTSEGAFTLLRMNDCRKCVSCVPIVYLQQFEGLGALLEGDSGQMMRTAVLFTILPDGHAWQCSPSAGKCFAFLRMCAIFLRRVGSKLAMILVLLHRSTHQSRASNFTVRVITVIGRPSCNRDKLRGNPPTQFARLDCPLHTSFLSPFH